MTLLSRLRILHHVFVVLLAQGVLSCAHTSTPEEEFKGDSQAFKTGDEIKRLATLKPRATDEEVSEAKKAGWIPLSEVVETEVVGPKNEGQALFLAGALNFKTAFQPLKDCSIPSSAKDIEPLECAILDWRKRNSRPSKHEKRLGRNVRKRAASNQMSSKRPLKLLMRDIAKADLQSLSGVSEKSLHQAFGRMRGESEKEKLERLQTQLVQDDRCYALPLYTALGMRFEQDFPQETAMKSSVSLYEKAVSCGRLFENGAFFKTAYRLGLIHVWQKNFETANTVLGLISEFNPINPKQSQAQALGAGLGDPAQDYRARALYWRMVSLSLLKKPDEAAVLRDRLVKEHPMTLHGILAFHERTEKSGKIRVKGDSAFWAFSRPEPWVALRSTSHPEFNLWLSAIETLQEDFRDQLVLGDQARSLEKFLVMRLVARLANSLAQGGLLKAQSEIEVTEREISEVESPESLDGELDGDEKDLPIKISERASELVIEPEALTYVAVLANRAQDRLSAFRMMTSLFKQKSEVFSLGALSLIYPTETLELVQKQAPQRGLNPLVILSLIRQESAFNPFARSTAGAMGLMQLMPMTAKRVAHVSRSKLFNPEVNVDVGSRYFASLVTKFEGDVEGALAGYNAGPERVVEWKRRYPVDSKLLFTDLIPFRETREYVASIARNYYWYWALSQSTYGGRSLASLSAKRAPASVSSYNREEPPLDAFDVFKPLALKLAKEP